MELTERAVDLGDLITESARLIRGRATEFGCRATTRREREPVELD